MKKYDLIIVGAGFTGLACAGTAAIHNLRTLVLERKHDAGVNLQTTGILVKEIAEEWDIPQRLTRKIHGVRLYSPSLDWFDLSSPGYYFLATDAPELMRWHAQQAIAAGAKIKFDTPYNSSKFENNQHIFEAEQFQCRYLVGCDGARSRVARNYNLGKNQHFLIGIEAEYDFVGDIDQNKLHVFLDSELAPGYIGWIVPGINCTQIGLAARFPHAPRLKDFIHKISPLINLNHMRPFSHRAGVIPCGGPVNYYSNQNVLLLGDAAGLVSPLTAGGIHPAVQIGKIAGTAISDYLNHGGINPGCYLKQSIPDFTLKKILRLLSDHITFPNSAYDLLLGTPVFRSIAQIIFFHHRGLFSLTAWRDLIKIFNN